MDAAETLGKDVGLKSACEAMGVSRATLYRRDVVLPRIASRHAIALRER